MNKLKIISTIIIKLFCYLIANIIPKNKTVWVFGAWYGQKYNDNPKAFFEYVNKHHSDKQKAIWITKNNDVIETIKENGYLAYHETSLLGLWNQFRASKAIVCQSLHDDVFSPAVGKKTEVVQLWHGIPLKKIMYDAFDTNKNNKNIFGRLIDHLSPYNEHRNDIIVATSPLTQKLLAKAFRAKPSQVLTCGFPRNDVFFEDADNSDKTQFKCIYMPTFRGGISSECDLFERYGFDFNTMEEQLTKHNIQLTLRMHPVNKPPTQIVEQIKKSTVIKLDESNDIYQSINQYDCLITDYSSVYIDFLLSNKPIVFAPFDLEEYKKRERSLYFVFEEVTLNPYCYTWNEIVERLVSLKNNDISTEYQNEYIALKDKYHNKPLEGLSPFSTKLYNDLTITR